MLIEITAAPGFESAYEKQISCLERARAIILWTDYYVKGKKLKRLTIDPKEVRRVGGRHIPFLITIETPGARSITKIVTEEYDLRAEIDDKLFNTWNLAVGDARSDRKKTTAPEPASSKSPVFEGE